MPHCPWFAQGHSDFWFTDNNSTTSVTFDPIFCYSQSNILSKNYHVTNAIPSPLIYFFHFEILKPPIAISFPTIQMKKLPKCGPGWHAHPSFRSRYSCIWIPVAVSDSCMAYWTFCLVASQRSWVTSFMCSLSAWDVIVSKSETFHYHLLDLFPASLSLCDLGQVTDSLQVFVSLLSYHKD